MSLRLACRGLFVDEIDVVFHLKMHFRTGQRKDIKSPERSGRFYGDNQFRTRNYLVWLGLLLNCLALFFFAVLRLAILSLGGRLRSVASEAGLSVTGKPSSDCNGSGLFVRERIAFKYSFSLWLTRDIAIPVFPALAVRPMR